MSAVHKASIRLEKIGHVIRGRTILRDLDLDVRAGELVALVGPNGCGKSTTLRLMSGLAEADAGRILIDGDDIRGLSRRDLSRRVALLTQAGQVPSAMRVVDLVGMGRYAHQSLLARASQADRFAITDAMQAMDIAELGERRLGELSGGQLQRCRMAMVLAQESGIVLLDEPTTFLDLRHQYALLEKARALALAGRAVVAVLHDLTQASLYADRIALMHEGTVVGIGPPAEVLNEENVLRVFGIRTRIVGDDEAVIHLPGRPGA